ncbi:MAG: 2-C-methyl-D-erythritol 4-phosphate cytidylyltransferase [Spirochaetae bacterium HGW-Spirochaetae-1]|jgi:2-C-methyl-D-erythritol 4-phosphate cytidylyltransferase|nr:MAG: 2-C-methyl-D-erythritol 4-phosphate cytidylyltransferase [Spirochaetae bacterium HGW-Spirochaetae-1]
MTIHAIILAGGQGTRLGAETPKQFLPLGDKPVIRWSMDAFSAVREIDHIIIVCPRERIPWMKDHVAACPEPKVLKITAGGATRQESAWNALNCHDFHDNDILLFHDAARPFVTVEIIANCIQEARNTGACGVYIPATDTITEIIDTRVRAIPPRQYLYQTQTPQAFRYGVIRHAHDLARSSGSGTATDDVSLVMSSGSAVAAVQGSPENFKITTTFDYELAKWIAEKQKRG